WDVFTDPNNVCRKLESTHADIRRVRTEVVEALKSFYSPSCAISAEEAIRIASKWTMYQQPQTEIQQQLESLSTSLNNVVQQLQVNNPSSTSPAGLVVSFSQRERMRKQLSQSKQMIALVEKLISIDVVLAEFDDLLEEQRLLEAANHLKQVEGLLRELSDNDKAGGQTTGAEDAFAASDRVIIRLVNTQWMKKQSQLVYTFQRLTAALTEWKDMSLTVSTKMLGSQSGCALNEALLEFWNATEVLELRGGYLKTLSKAMSSNVLRPLLSRQSERLVVSIQGDASIARLRVADETKPASAKKSEVALMKERFAQAIQVLSFVHARVFGGSDEIMAQFGEFVWKQPGNLESMLITFIQDSIPQDPVGLAAYSESLQAMVDELQKNVGRLGMSTGFQSQLRTILSQVNSLYAKKRRHCILASARQIISAGYHDSVKVSGATERCNLAASGGSTKGGKMGKGNGVQPSNNPADDEVESGCFQVPDYRVTVCAHDLVELVHQTLIEACSTTSDQSKVLVQTSRDIFFLFRTIVPTLHKDDIANDCRSCMLFHNDCLYIAHHMITIGHQYKSRLKSPLNVTCTMIDLVPAFRNAGEQALTRFSESMRDETTAGLSILPRLSDGHTKEAEEFVKASLYKLNRVSDVWREGLPQAVYHRALAAAVSPLVQGFVKKVVTEADASAYVSTNIHSLVSLLLECQILFESTSHAENHIPQIRKLQQLSDILVQPLSTIREKFMDGALKEFTTDELRALIRALFRESPERQDVLTSFSR
ncbi:TPA: hypothetical protein N0F65_007853, partial [Lagenidium giganteum]